MHALRISFMTAVMAATMTAGAAAQAGPPEKVSETVEPLSLSGPRFGVTWLSQGIRERAEDFIHLDVGPVITQFGWQYETRFFSLEAGPTGVSELVFLVGGLEQSQFLPSLSWIVGIRSATGAEFGIGPNVTPAGAALAIAGGITIQNGPIFFPINAAVVPSRNGIRVSLLAGFNMRKAPTSTAVSAR